MEEIKFSKQEIIKLLYAQYPSLQMGYVAKALKRCETGFWLSSDYLFFHADRWCNLDKWKVVERIELTAGFEKIVIEMLENGEVGAIEFNTKNHH